MKTTLKTIVIAVLVSMSTLTYANKNKGNVDKAVSPELDVRIVAVEESKIVIFFDKLEGEKVAIKIFDNEGSLVYTEKDVEGTVFSKKFDMSALPAGEYTYMVSNDLYSVKKVIYTN